MRVFGNYPNFFSGIWNLLLMFMKILGDRNSYSYIDSGNLDSYIHCTLGAQIPTCALGARIPRKLLGTAYYWKFCAWVTRPQVTRGQVLAFFPEPFRPEPPL